MPGRREDTKLKKKICLALMACMLIGTVTGCDKKDTTEQTETVAESTTQETSAEESTEETSAEETSTEETTAPEVINARALKDLDVENYVTIGEYKGLEVEMPDMGISDDDVNSYMMDMYSEYVTEDQGIKDRPVAVGDTVDIDYEGKKDGVAFDGGTAQGQKLGIGSGRFIEGFEDGLVGVKPGETVDLNLKFPDDYGAEDLAGAEVVFTVKVNYIMPEGYDNEIVSQMGIDGVETEEQLREYVRNMMEEYMASMTGMSKSTLVLQAFIEGCEFKELPEDLLKKYKSLAETAMTNVAQAQSMTAEEYVAAYYGKAYDEFMDEYAKEALRQGMAMQAVANKENIVISDEELDETLMKYANSMGYTTIEEFIGTNSKEDYRESMMFDKVLNFIVENANMKKN